jgi:hypothetical protein
MQVLIASTGLSSQKGVLIPLANSPACRILVAFSARARGR